MLTPRRTLRSACARVARWGALLRPGRAGGPRGRLVPAGPPAAPDVGRDRDADSHPPRGILTARVANQVSPVRVCTLDPNTVVRLLGRGATRTSKEVVGTRRPLPVSLVAGAG
jgi:hypothetical protein